MASTPNLIIDAVVDKIAAWAQPISPDTTVVLFLPDVTDTTAMTGRRVYLWLDGWSETDEDGTRAIDGFFVDIGIEVVEKFTAATRPTKGWIQERVDFVWDLWNVVRNVREVPLFPAPLDDVIPMVGRIDEPYDAALLRKDKLFWCGFPVQYRRAV